MPQHSLDCTHQNVLLPTSCFLVPFYWKRGFQSSCPCGMICMSQVIQNQVSSNGPFAWSFFMHIHQLDMVRMSQTFQNEWVQRSINMELLHAFYTIMTYMAVPPVSGTIITIFWHENVYHYDRDSINHSGLILILMVEGACDAWSHQAWKNFQHISPAHL